MAGRIWGLVEVGLLGESGRYGLAHLSISDVSHDWFQVEQFRRQLLHCELSQLNNILIILNEPLGQLSTADSLISFDLTHSPHNQGQGYE